MNTQDSSPKQEALSESSENNSSKPKTTKVKKEIQVVSVPYQDGMIDQEMAELFEEDQVTHQHGSAEPEGD